MYDPYYGLQNPYVNQFNQYNNSNMLPTVKLGCLVDRRIYRVYRWSDRS